MKQYPSKLKYKKNHKIKSSFMKIKDHKTFFIIRGRFGIKAKESGKLTFQQIEACRKSIRRDLRKKGKILLRTFTYASVTKKALASRMGKGKGTHSHWMCPIKAGQLLCEVEGVVMKKGLSSLKRGSYKLPMKTKIVKNVY